MLWTESDKFSAYSESIISSKLINSLVLWRDMIMSNCLPIILILMLVCPYAMIKYIRGNYGSSSCEW